VGKGLTFAPVKAASAAISTAHDLAGFGSSITAHPTVRCVRSAAQRILGMVPTNRKRPLPMSMAVRAAAALATAQAATADLLLATYIMVCFTGFLRYSDAVSIPRCGVQLFADRAELWVPRRKNDQARRGNVITLSAGSGPACPVRLLRRYLAATAKRSKHTLLFGSPAQHAQPWPYHQARKAVLTALASAYDTSPSVMQRVFGLHSLRSGGATAAAQRLTVGKDIPLQQFMAHGGWRSNKSVAAYVEPSMEQRKKITQAMGL
jgi:integrase